jgi:putative transposase
MNSTVLQGWEAEGIKVPMTKLCRWFEVPSRTMYHQSTKAQAKAQERFEMPIRAMIE